MGGPLSRRGGYWVGRSVAAVAISEVGGRSVAAVARRKAEDTGSMADGVRPVRELLIILGFGAIPGTGTFSFSEFRNSD